MDSGIASYNARLEGEYGAICGFLATEIERRLTGALGKVWHAHPVWFLDGNPIVGYSREKAGIRLMFWSGADFGEAGLAVRGGKFKDASIFYGKRDEIRLEDLERWLDKARDIQWDYKNIVKNRGRLTWLGAKGGEPGTAPRQGS